MAPGTLQISTLCGSGGSDPLRSLGGFLCASGPQRACGSWCCPRAILHSATPSPARTGNQGLRSSHHPQTSSVNTLPACTQHRLEP